MLDLKILDEYCASKHDKEVSIALGKYLAEHPECKEGILSHTANSDGSVSWHLNTDKLVALIKDAGADPGEIAENKISNGFTEALKQLFG